MPVLVTALAYLSFAALLFACSATDIRERKIPNKLVLAICAAWAVWRVLLVLFGGNVWAVLAESVANAGSAIAFTVVMFSFVALLEWMRKKPLLGGGDIKLMAAMVLFMGLEGTLVATFVACMVSLIYAAAKLPKGIPFGPCLLCGVAATFLLL